LLDYIGRHEVNFTRALSKYEQGAATKLLQTWVQFGGEEASDKIFREETSIQEVRNPVENDVLLTAHFLHGIQHLDLVGDGRRCNASSHR
jgi:hypothetical protein